MANLEYSVRENFEKLFPGKDINAYGNQLGRFINDCRVKFAGQEILDHIKNGTIQELADKATYAAEVDKLWYEYSNKRGISGISR